jgi:hypothetical protein
MTRPSSGGRAAGQQRLGGDLGGSGRRLCLQRQDTKRGAIERVLAIHRTSQSVRSNTIYLPETKKRRSRLVSIWIDGFRIAGLEEEEASTYRFGQFRII